MHIALKTFYSVIILNDDQKCLLGAGVVELGAQWIHGRGENPVWKYVNENNITGREWGLNWHFCLFVFFHLIAILFVLD